MGHLLYFRGQTYGQTDGLIGRVGPSPFGVIPLHLCSILFMIIIDKIVSIHLCGLGTTRLTPSGDGESFPYPTDTRKSPFKSRR